MLVTLSKRISVTLIPDRSRNCSGRKQQSAVWFLTFRCRWNSVYSNQRPKQKPNRSLWESQLGNHPGFLLFLLILCPPDCRRNGAREDAGQDSTRKPRQTLSGSFRGEALCHFESTKKAVDCPRSRLFANPTRLPLSEECADSFLSIGRQRIHAHNLFGIGIGFGLIQIDLCIKRLFPQGYGQRTGFCDTFCEPPGNLSKLRCRNN